MIDQVLSSDELHSLYEQVYALATNNSPVRMLLYRPLFTLIAPEDHTAGALCSAGNNALTIMPDGTVFHAGDCRSQLVMFYLTGFIKSGMNLKSSGGSEIHRTFLENVIIAACSRSVGGVAPWPISPLAIIWRRIHSAGYKFRH